MTYSRILFPDRAEDMRHNPQLQKGYKVFLKHWRPNFIEFLKRSYERVAIRNSTFALVVYGPQGVGKTLLADKLKNDFKETQEALTSRQQLVFDQSNIWHVMSAGDGNVTTLQSATISTDLIDASDDENWVKTVSEWSRCKTHINRKIVILDNAERAYFGSSLAQMNPADYIARADQPAIFTHLAQQFVRHAREQMKGCLFIILGNNEEFLNTFYETCETQHRDMVNIQSLPLPSNEDKERIVRININRLNPISYWACVDKSGPEKKLSLHQKLDGTSTFPDSFTAVDEAFADSQQRQGRPANKCLLTLAVISPDLTNTDRIAQELGNEILTPDFSHEAAKLYVLPKNYCQKVLPSRSQDAQMVESEFTLRLLFLSDIWTRQILGDERGQIDAINAFKELLKQSRVGSLHSARDQLLQSQTDFCDLLLRPEHGITTEEVQKFWSRGIVRSVQYEGILKRHFANYNTASFATGFNKRPDILLEQYIPCAVLSARSQENERINQAISRNCHAVEVTAIKDLTLENVEKYLASKLPNYIELLQEL